MTDDDTFAASILHLERQFWQSIQDKDTDVAEQMMDYPSIVTGAQGVTSIPDGATYRKMMTGGAWTLEQFAFSNVEVRRLGPNEAAIAYRVEEQLTFDGKPLTLVAFDSSVWVRRDGAWRCAVHTEAPAGDPFGRTERSAT